MLFIFIKFAIFTAIEII